MTRRIVTAMTAACLVFLSMQSAQASTATLVSIKTPRGVTQKFILIKPENPVAAVILFAGGKGALGLSGASSMAWGAGNFLVRTREKFAGHELMVAVIDAPSDQSGKMSAIFRMSKGHADDIAAVAAYLKKEKNVPVWLVGTSMGTFSAANGAIGGRNIDGLVLTSTITRSKPDWKIASSHRDGVASMALANVTVPTLIVSHKKDACDITPASDAPKLQARLTKAAKVEVILLDGGSPPQSEPCEAKSQHGYLGIEDQAVSAVAKFISANLK
jgi:pimeloyl-ACP methyl ester carboxylesterase